MAEQHGKTLVPQIRFAGFTDPWEQRKLGDIVGIYDGVHQTPNYQNSGVMFLSVENIATLKSSKFISEEDFKRDYKVFPQENDILMTRIGDVGTTNVVTDNGLKAFYVSLALLKYKSTDPYFLSNAIQSDYVQKGLANRTLKTAIPMKINKDEIGKVSVMLPVSATEQQQIGTYFHNLDNLITLHQRKYNKLLNVKKSMLEKMFPKNGSNIPEIRFKGFTDPWEQRKVYEIADRFDNLRVPVAANLRVAGDTPYYGANGIQDYVDGYTHDGEYVLVAEDGASDLKNYPVNYVNGRIWVNNHAHVLQGKNNIASNRFLSYAISLANIESVLVGGGRAKLNADVMMNLNIDLPTYKEQCRVAEYFSNLDNLITLHQCELDKLKNIKKSMLEKLFL